MDAADLGVGDYGDLDRQRNHELRRVLNEERCRQLGDTMFMVDNPSHNAAEGLRPRSFLVGTPHEDTSKFGFSV